MRMMVYTVIFALCAVVGPAAVAQDRQVLLYAPQALVDTGLMKHILPRFSLKTQVRVKLVDRPEAAQMILGAEGRALFQGAGQVWHMQVAQQSEWTDRFAKWLTGDVGQRTIFGFAPDGAAIFSAPQAQKVEVIEVEIEGDAEAGWKLSRVSCGRCHVVDEASRGGGIGSTPSFFVLRAMADWEERFSAFYVLKPHPAFTQIADVTDPFPEDRPSPIVPIEMTVEELEAVLAYVSRLQPADLGAPLAFD